MHLSSKQSDDLLYKTTFPFIKRNTYRRNAGRPKKKIRNSFLIISPDLLISNLNTVFRVGIARQTIPNAFINEKKLFDV